MSHSLVRLTLRRFRSVFANTVPEAEVRAAFERYVVPETRRIFCQAAISPSDPGSPMRVNFRNASRAPLLLVAGSDARPGEVVRRGDHRAPHRLGLEQPPALRARAVAGRPRLRGYDQDVWVEAQRYQAAPWPDLLDLWLAYNLHLARVMEAVPDAVRLRSHIGHNLDQLAWKPVATGEPARLDYFMQDYVEHLRHHQRQIEALHLPGTA